MKLARRPDVKVGVEEAGGYGVEGARGDEEGCRGTFSVLQAEGDDYFEDFWWKIHLFFLNGGW